jgi:hypothetical protein
MEAEPMGWAERAAQQAAEVKANKEAGLSLTPTEQIVGRGPSPWLQERMKEFGGNLVHASNELAGILNPPTVVGPDGRSQAQKIDPLRTIIMSQLLMMRALSAMNDCLLVITTGQGVLKPIDKQATNGGTS